jgi:outer membrane lipoprotein SlyB
LGAITGGLLGAVIGCGEGIFDDECRDTVAVVGAIGGAILGNAVASRLGDHDGFQYVVDIDNSDEDISIIQSGEDQIPIGSKVTVSIGTNTRIIISE